MEAGRPGGPLHIMFGPGWGCSPVSLTRFSSRFNLGFIPAVFLPLGAMAAVIRNQEASESKVLLPMTKICQ